MEKKDDLNASLNLLARSAAVVFVGVLLSKIFTYVYRIIIARQFGPDIYGVFSLAVNILSIFITLSLLGFESGLVRFIPLYNSKKKEGNINYMIKFSSKIVLFTSLFLAAILFMLSKTIAIGIFHEPRLVFYLQVFSLLTPFVAFTAYMLSIINGYEKIGLYSFIENISKNLSNVIWIGILILAGAGVSSAPWSYLLGSISVLILTYIIFRKNITIPLITKINTETHKKIRKEFLSYSIPLLFFVVANVIMAWIDSFSIGYFKTALEVGWYNAAIPLALLMNIAPQLFIKLFFPLITREYGNNKNTIRELSKQVNKWIFFINIALFMLLFTFPEAFLNLFFGKDYVVAATSLRILSIGMLAISMLRISDRLIAMIGNSKALLFNILIAAAANFILNTIFIPMPYVFGIENASGINGAALATTISNILLGVLSFAQARKYTSVIPFRRKMLNFFGASLVSIILIWPFRSAINSSSLWLITLSVSFIYLYLIFSWLFKGLDKNDLFVMRSFTSKIKSKKESHAEIISSKEDI